MIPGWLVTVLRNPATWIAVVAGALFWSGYQYGAAHEMAKWQAIAIDQSAALQRIHDEQMREAETRWGDQVKQAQARVQQARARTKRLEEIINAMRVPVPGGDCRVPDSLMQGLQDAHAAAFPGARGPEPAR